MMTALKIAFENADLDYVVSPYEADAQLAFLFANKKIAAVMTSDADLFVYGVTVIIFPPFKKNCHVIDGKSKLQNGVFDFRASIAAACRLQQSRYLFPLSIPVHSFNY